MTYAAAIARNHNQIGFYLEFDGIAAKLSTHAFGDAPYSLSGTFHTAIVAGSLSVTGSSLDRDRSLVTPGGLSCELADSAAVRAFLARRGGTEDFLDVPISATATSLTVGALTSTYADGATIYCERETITLGTHSTGGLYTGCTRGADGSQARAHHDASTLSDRPRFWVGRRASLYAVDLQSYEAQAFKAGVLNRSPRFVSGVWNLDFVDVTRELRRKLFTGWSPQRALSKAVGDTEFTFGIDPTQFSDEGTASVRLEYGDAFEVYTLSSGDVDTAGDALTVQYSGLVAASSGEYDPDLGGDVDLDIQQVCQFVADPAVAALMLMLSDLGDGANHATYDKLAGLFPTSQQRHAPRRCGAALPSSWVDVDSWEAMIGVSPPIAVYLDEPVALLDFLTREICWRLGGYLMATGAGKITFQRYRAAVAAGSIATLGAGDYGHAGADTIDDEAGVLAFAAIECNYDPADREYHRAVEVSWPDLVGTYGDNARTLRLKSKTAWFGQGRPSALVSPPFGNEQQLVASFDRLYSRVREGVRRVRKVLPWKRHLDFVPSKVFKDTDSRLPDHEGGLGVTARQYEVTSSEENLEAGTVTVEAEEMPLGFLVAPSCIIASYDSGAKEITIDVAAGFGGDLSASATPGFDWGDQTWACRIYDASATPPFSVSETNIVDGTSGTLLALQNAHSAFTYGANDVVVLEISANTTELNQHGADVRDHLNVGTTYETEWA